MPKWGVDADRGPKNAGGASPSRLQCWQGDDVAGFESAGGLSGGGIMARGIIRGRARTADETAGARRRPRAMSFDTLANNRFSLHAIYLGAWRGKPVERNQIVPAHFQRWMDLGGAGVGHRLGFQPHVLSHPRAADGFNLSPSRPGASGGFGSSHGIAWPQDRRRRSAAAWARPASPNVWIPDGNEGRDYRP